MECPHFQGHHLTSEFMTETESLSQFLLCSAHVCIGLTDQQREWTAHLHRLAFRVPFACICTFLFYFEIVGDFSYSNLLCFVLRSESVNIYYNLVKNITNLIYLL